MNLTLSDKHLKNARVVPQRVDILDRLSKGGVAVEVGVARGDFSEQILQRLSPAKLVLIDLWESPNPDYGEAAFKCVKDRFANEIAQRKVDVQKCFSWQGLESLGPSSVDFVYIDAAHDYDSVKKDLQAAMRALRRDGVIAGHDYIRWARGPSRYGVIEAVNEFVIDNGFEFIFFSNEPNQHVSFAVRQSAGT